MNNVEITTEQIKQYITLEDVLNRYVPQYQQRNRIGRFPCFIHNGKDCNMVLKNNICYCHVCHEHADIFKVVQITHDCDFKTAKEIIDHDFGLGLINKKIDYKIIKQYEQLKKEREFKQQQLVRLQKQLDYQQNLYFIIYEFIEMLKEGIKNQFKWERFKYKKQNEHIIKTIIEQEENLAEVEFNIMYIKLKIKQKEVIT